MQTYKPQRFSAEQYAEAILKEDRIMLARAITLIESSLEKDQLIAEKLIEYLLPHTGNSLRIGITGVPGVGKSSFIESFGEYIIEQTQSKLAVLAIDPTSQKSRGSILGDKTRMEKLSQNPQCFIRPSPAGNSLGGIAKKTRESLLLCEAAGFNLIFIETVGVGQSEVLVSEMTDFFLLLMLAGAGDELQGIKKGIMEMADLLVITKADGENKLKSLEAKQNYQNALHLFRANEMDWHPPVTTCSALYKEGLENIWFLIKQYIKSSKEKGFFEKKRQKQQIDWFRQTLKESLVDYFFRNEGFQKTIIEAEQSILEQKKDAFGAVREILGKYLQTKD